MKYIKYTFSLLLVVILGITSCDIEEIPDPNNPDLAAIEANASIGDLQLLVSGTENLLRSEVGFYYDMTGIIGREFYYFTNSDPRYTGEVLGKGESTLDNAGFYGTRPYAGRYKIIKNANILINAVANTSESLSAGQKGGYTGYAKTAQAYSYLLAVNFLYQNGIRIDVADASNLGAFVSYDAALAAISELLDEANSELSGAEFLFSLSDAFSGFDSPATFAQFNRALKARVEIYRGNNSAALNALSSSFMNMSGNFNMGPSHFYSTAGTDQLNPVFRTPDNSEGLIAHPSYLTDMMAGDTRASKVIVRSATAVLDGLSGDYDVAIYASNDSYIPIIRNEELILISAEANIGSNNTAAIAALDVIRTAHGLAAYSGGTTDADLVNELLYNRRYSLFAEGHRWIDMRRYNRLSSLPIDRAGDNVWEQFPIPVSENQ